MAIFNTVQIPATNLSKSILGEIVNRPGFVGDSDF